MNIIVRIVTGAIQDADDNSYDRVVIVYVALSIGSVLVCLSLLLLSFRFIDLRQLQWTRKQRFARSEVLLERKRRFYEEDKERNKKISHACFGALLLLIVGSWCGYFWGVATGNND